MCKIPKVVIVAPADVGGDLRKRLSSLEYEIAAVVSSADDAAGVSGDVAVVWEPDESALLRLRELSFKTVAIHGDSGSADMKLDPEDIPSFKSRIWELFRPA